MFFEYGILSLSILVLLFNILSMYIVITDKSGTYYKWGLSDILAPIGLLWSIDAIWFN